MFGSPEKGSETCFFGFWGAVRAWRAGRVPDRQVGQMGRVDQKSTSEVKNRLFQKCFGRVWGWSLEVVGGRKGVFQVFLTNFWPTVYTDSVWEAILRGWFLVFWAVFAQKIKVALNHPNFLPCRGEGVRRHFRRCSEWTFDGQAGNGKWNSLIVHAAIFRTSTWEMRSS